MRKWLDNSKLIIDQLIKNKKVILSLSIGAVVVGIAVNYYIQIRSKRKRVFNITRSFFQIIPELKSPNVRMKNPEYVEQVLSKVLQSGMHSLQVFEDLRDFYLPIEHDHKMTKQSKIPFMIEWWSKSFDLVVETQITRENLIEIVRNSSTHLREGCHWFFNTLERHNVPLLIFSAGLGDVIQEWIAQDCGTFKNMKIVSNFMSFNESTNKITGFKGEMIHVFNKNETALLDTEYESLIESRPNVILLGDSPGDIDMTAGLKNLKNILKIGFLNDKIDENLQLYLTIYDIVILKDSTFNVPNSILRSIS